MEDQREKESQILSYVGYTLLGILFIVVLVLVYIERSSTTTKPTYTEVLTIPEVEFLSPDEVAVERTKYENKSNPNTTTPVEKTITGTSAPVPQEDLVNLEKKVQEPINIIQQPDLSEPETLNSDPATEPPFFQVDPEIKKNQTMKNLSFSGSIFSKELNKSRIIVHLDGGDFSLIHITKNTKITINGKHINPEDLHVGDYVSVSGQGFDSSNEIVADVIVFNGSVSIF